MRHALLRIGMAPVITAIIFIIADNAFSAPPNKPSGPSSTATQNWDTVLPAEQRFTVLPGFNNQAVRDNETGLVWERTPNGTQAREDAIRTCWLRQVGGRAGTTTSQTFSTTPA